MTTDCQGTRQPSGCQWKQPSRDPLLIDDLRIVIPFCHANLIGWHIRAEDRCLTNITFEGINEKTDAPKPLFFGPVG